MEEAVDEDEVTSHTFSPARMSHLTQEGACGDDVGKSSSRVKAASFKVPDMKKLLSKKAMILKGCVYLVTIGMLISLLMGLNMSWTALSAALALVVIDFKDAGPCLDKVTKTKLDFRKLI